MITIFDVQCTYEKLILANLSLISFQLISFPCFNSKIMSVQEVIKFLNSLTSGSD